MHRGRHEPVKTFCARGSFAYEMQVGPVVVQWFYEPFQDARLFGRLHVWRDPVLAPVRPQPAVESGQIPPLDELIEMDDRGELPFGPYCDWRPGAVHERGRQ